MRTGTKELLFGYHHFLLHPVCVILAWRRLYGEWPRWREAVCILIHDWGYWGKPNVEGAEGTAHPEFGARIANALFGREYRDLVRCHSRRHARAYGREPSRLCRPDKLAITYCPLALFVLLTRMSGAWREWEVMAAERGYIAKDTPDLVFASRYIAEDIETVYEGRCPRCHEGIWSTSPPFGAEEGEGDGSPT